MCTVNSPVRSTASTCSSLEEAMRQSLFSTDPLDRPTSRRHETRASVVSGRTGKIPRLLWRCSLSARSLLSRDRGGDCSTENKSRARRNTLGSLFSTSPRSSTSTTTETRPSHQRTTATTTQLSTVFLHGNSEDLQLFREEAEYSDYLSAHVTGQHFERRRDGIIFYEIEAHLSKQQWCVVRRFSDFRALRQQLIKHFSRSKRRREPRCAICENELASIIETSFPSRHVWVSRLFSSTSGGTLEDEIVEDRKTRFQEFVAMCLLTIRSLRQHMRVLPDSTTCEISVALQMMEEFLGLSFTRYLGFLGERGIVDQMSETTRQSLSLRRRQSERIASSIYSTC
ncbi:unnamed protein product [Peronospora belbahrii]|uniref:PX domain-containing protein n=1 Tax=Peronospora belbahrii TaxID=622444 RepID=A0AAU9L331_9STRA|nr:unnamed protein product [Peronospora belbahrii]CAH0513207.1 unnamed protein product [Peronospora belbahrii]